MSIIKKYRSLSLPKKAVLWFTFCSIVIKGIGLLSSPIFTRLLSNDEYGKLSILLSFEQVFIILATWEMYLGPYQRGLFKYENVKLFTSLTVLLSNIISIAFLILTLTCHSWIQRTTGFSLALLIMMFIYAIALPGYQCWMIQKRTKYDYKKVVFVTIGYSLASVIVPICAINYFGSSAVVKYGANLITGIIFFAFFYLSSIQFRDNFKQFEECKIQIKYMMTFQAPLVIHALSYLVLSQADRIMISKMCGNSQAAFYSVAYGLASVISIVQTSVNQVFTPWRYDKLKQKDYKAIEKTTNTLLVIVSAAILVFILLMPEIMKALYTKDYYEAIWCISPISVGVYFMFLYSIFVNIESYFEVTKYITMVSLVCGVINIGMNYFCINLFGYIAAGYTTLVSYIFFSIGHYFFMKKIIDKRIPGVKLFSVPVIVAISAVVIGLSILVTLLYNYPIIRYTLLGGIVILFLIFEKKIKALFGAMR